MDVVYLFRHSVHNDLEIRYSLRSIEKHFSNVGKVWIFGDRPTFLSDDTSVVEHVSQSVVARIGDFPTPVTNFFQMMFLASLIPELDAEYLLFCDDYVLLDDLTVELARKSRYLGDMRKAKGRGRGAWKDSLWRTYDLLARLGYPGYNFETHTPTYLRRKWVMEAYCDFKDYVTDDRWYGMLGITAVLNHVVKHRAIELTRLGAEGTRAGFWRDEPPYDSVVEACEGKLFFNFDDRAFGEGIRQFLSERFPSQSVYEKAAVRRPDAGPFHSNDSAAWYPPVVMKNRNQLGDYLNHQGLDGEGVELGTGHGWFAEKILRCWHGRMLHCVDLWHDMPDGTCPIGNQKPCQQDRIFRQASVRLARLGDRCRIHRLTSREAAQQFTDHSLDFVYLDACHDHGAVTGNMELWSTKIRPGGLLAGHDYLDGVLPSGQFEVKRAVDEWARRNNRTVTCSGENVWRSWFIQL